MWIYCFHWFNESLTGIAVVPRARDVNWKKGIKPALLADMERNSEDDRLYLKNFLRI